MLSLTIYRQCISAISYYEKNLATGSVRCIDSEIPFDIPNGWEWAKIGNIFLHTSGKQQSRNNTNGSPHEFITTSNLYWGYFKLDNVKIMNFTDEEVGTCSATKGDLLVCEGGDVGRAAIWNQKDICLQNHVHKLRAYLPVCQRYFLFVLWHYKNTGLIGGKGIGIQGLSANTLHKLILPLPPIKEQKRIVDAIDSYSKILSK